MRIIRTTKELLALRNDAGAVEIDDDVRIECDVPWSAGKHITGIRFTGNADFERYAIFKGYSDFRGDVIFQADTVFLGNADFRCDAIFQGYSDFWGDAIFRGYADFGGDAVFRRNAVFWGDYLIIEGDMFWSQMHKPFTPENTYIKRVFPPAYQRYYWTDRLGMSLDGCYKDICRMLTPKLCDILRDEKWTPTERWMLETLRASDQPTPDWVALARKERKETAAASGEA